jgi:tryptophan 2,3-dioxygenase
MSESPYEKYIHADKILSFQKKEDELVCDGELDFQGVQQEAEFIWNRINFMLKRIKQNLESNKIIDGIGLLYQAADLWGSLTNKTQELLKRLWPNDFLKVRKIIGEGASTADSPRYRESEKLGRNIWPSFENLLKSNSLTLESLISQDKETELNSEMKALMGAMMWYDYRVQEFSIAHLYLVFGIIGDRTVGLKGGTTEFLINRYQKYIFPKLWDSINNLYLNFKPL